MAPNKKNLGFTLFEVLVVVIIILAFTGMSIAAYNSFNEQQRLQNETKKFIETLELAKKKTLAGDKPCASYSGSYRVNWTSTSYILSSVGCAAQASYTTFLPIAHQFISASEVYFDRLGLFATGACAILKNNNSNRCRKISVEASTNIEEDSELDCACP